MEIRTYIPWGFRKVIGAGVVLFECLLSRIATATIVTQPDVQHRYSKAIVIENAPLTRGPIINQANAAYASFPAASVPTLVYSGIITHDRGLFKMLDLVVRLNDFRPWRLKLVGHIGSSSDFELAKRHPGWRYVEHLGHVHHSLSLAHIKSADIGLGLLDDVGGYSRASMAKLYEYMQMETPFVVSDFQRWRDSIRDLPAGLFVDVDDIEWIAKQIDALFDDKERYYRMQKIGRTFVEQEFNWELLSQPLREIAGRFRKVECQPSEA